MTRVNDTHRSNCEQILASSLFEVRLIFSIFICPVFLQNATSAAYTNFDYAYVQTFWTRKLLNLSFILLFKLSATERINFRFSEDSDARLVQDFRTQMERAMMRELIEPEKWSLENIKHKLIQCCVIILIVFILFDAIKKFFFKWSYFYSSYYLQKMNNSHIPLFYWTILDK